MAEPLIRVHVHQQAGTIILNRPDKRNALSRQLLLDLEQAFYDLHMQRSVRAVILTGAGAAFCAGMDLGEMQETAQGESPAMQWHADAAQYRDLIEQMLRFPKPLIAAVNGPAVAGGLGLALACDVVIAAPAAKFGLPEPRRGVVAGIVAPLLVFRLGGSYAARMLMLADILGAEEALRIGLAHQVLPADQLWARGVELAEECALSAPEALQLTRRMLNESIGEWLFTQLSAGAAASATARTTEAAVEGLAAFHEKRAPKWK